MLPQVKKHSDKNLIKNVKNVKKRYKNKIKIVDVIKKRYLFNSTPDAQEMAFKTTRNMPFSLVLQKLSSFQASSEIFNTVLFLVSYILINYCIQYSVIYDPIEFRCCYFESASC